MKDHIFELRRILIIAVKHTTWAVVKLKPEKNSGQNGIRTHDLCDTGAVLYGLSYQALWDHLGAGHFVVHNCLCV